MYILIKSCKECNHLKFISDEDSCGESGYSYYKCDITKSSV